jgi:hypothetical protein
MRSGDEASDAQPPSPQRKAVCVAVALVIGLTTAYLGFTLTASPVWFSAIPVALALGWFVAMNPGVFFSRRSGHNGPVLW